MRIGGGNLAGEAHHQGQGVLGRGQGGGCGGIQDENALGGGGIEVDVVNTDTGPGDGFQDARVFKHFGRHFCAGANDERIILADDRRQLIFLQPDLRIEGVPGLLEKVQSLFGQFVSDENAHW